MRKFSLALALLMGGVLLLVAGGQEKEKKKEPEKEEENRTCYCRTEEMYLGEGVSEYVCNECGTSYNDHITDIPGLQVDPCPSTGDPCSYPHCFSSRFRKPGEDRTLKMKINKLCDEGAPVITEIPTIGHGHPISILDKSIVQFELPHGSELKRIRAYVVLYRYESQSTAPGTVHNALFGVGRQIRGMSIPPPNLQVNSACLCDGEKFRAKVKCGSIEYIVVLDKIWME